MYLIVAHLQVKGQEYACASLSDLLGALSFTSIRNERNTLDSFPHLSLNRLQSSVNVSAKDVFSKPTLSLFFSNPCLISGFCPFS